MNLPSDKQGTWTDQLQEVQMSDVSIDTWNVGILEKTHSLAHDKLFVPEENSK